MEEMLIDNERRFRKVFEEGPLGVAIISLDFRIVRVNQKFRQMLGYSEKELSDMNFMDITHPEDTEKDQMLSQSLIRGEIPLYTIEKRYLKKSRQVIWINLTATLSRSESGVPLYFIAMTEDITERKRLENELLKAATTDKLTGIFNRQALDGKMADELKRSRRYHLPFSLVMLDIDKLINDNHGHVTGDHVLQAVADMLKRNIRSTDMLGRWGGEEFMIVTPGTTSPDAVILAEKLRQSLEKMEVDSLNTITASFGVTEYQSEDSLDTMIKRVDNYLYKAKLGGRNRVEAG
jgi:diguanylate cyclase (GGDEF)-like protein/PAS domain S-box-containing protein